MERSTNRVLSLCILRVLEKFTDCDHCLKQSEIIRHLESEFGITCERKAIRNHVEALIDVGYDIAVPGAGYSGYYLRQRVLEDGELRLLLDSVLANRQIPKTQAAELLRKLKGFGNVHFGNRMRHLHSINDWAGHDINSMFYNIELIDEAIEQDKKIAFCYYAYGTDKKLHKRRAEKYIFNPYQMIVSIGRYYLVGNMEKYDNLSHFRIDLIGDIEVLDLKRKPPRDILKLADYDKERVYPFQGEAEWVEIKIDNSIIGDIVDYFGSDFSIVHIGKGRSVVRMKTVVKAFFYWALQYGESLEVMQPPSLRQQIGNAVKRIADKYNDMEKPDA